MVPQNIVITGGGSGLGRAMAEELAMSGHRVFALDIHFPEVSELEKLYSKSPAIQINNIPFNVRDERSAPAVADSIRDYIGGPINILINNAAINKINYLEDVSETDWDWTMDVNAGGIFRMSKAFLPQLTQSKGTILNIISNASHMPMTSSLAYNASKGAAHIMTLQMARELTRRHGITVFGISPNKMDGTGMSRSIEEQVCRVRGWTPEHAAKYQQDAILCGQETSPTVLAQFVAYLLSDRIHHKFLTGCIIPYGA